MPLKDPCTNTAHSQNKEKKANVLNRQLQTVLSHSSPLRHGQICIEKLQWQFDKHIPDKFSCNYQVIPDISMKKA